MNDNKYMSGDDYRAQGKIREEDLQTYEIIKKLEKEYEKFVAENAVNFDTPLEEVLHKIDVQDEIPSNDKDSKEETTLIRRILRTVIEFVYSLLDIDIEVGNENDIQFIKQKKKKEKRKSILESIINFLKNILKNKDLDLKQLLEQEIKMIKAKLQAENDPSILKLLTERLQLLESLKLNMMSVGGGALHAQIFKIIFAMAIADSISNFIGKGRLHAADNNIFLGNHSKSHGQYQTQYTQIYNNSLDKALIWGIDTNAQYTVSNTKNKQLDIPTRLNDVGNYYNVQMHLSYSHSIGSSHHNVFQQILETIEKFTMFIAKQVKALVDHASFLIQPTESSVSHYHRRANRSHNTNHHDIGTNKSRVQNAFQNQDHIKNNFQETIHIDRQQHLLIRYVNGNSPYIDGNLTCTFSVKTTFCSIDTSNINTYNPLPYLQNPNIERQYDNTRLNNMGNGVHRK